MPAAYGRFVKSTTAVSKQKSASWYFTKNISKPFVWTADADSILGKVPDSVKRISNSEHSGKYAFVESHVALCRDCNKTNDATRQRTSGACVRTGGTTASSTMPYIQKHQPPAGWRPFEE